MASQNFSVTSNVDGRFVQTGGRDAIFRVTGAGRGDFRFRITWNDNPDTEGDALGTVTIAGVSQTTGGETGNVTLTAFDLTPGDYACNFNAQNDFLSFNGSKLEFRDDGGNDVNATIEFISVTQDTFTFTVSNSISASPNPVFCNDVTTISWTGTTSQGNLQNTLSGIISTTTSATAGGGTFDLGLQSVVGSNSPATRTQFITTCRAFTNGLGNYCVSDSLTIQVYNDNTPNNYTVPSPTNLEPSTLTTIQVGPITGIDCPNTVVSAGPGTSVSTNNSNFSSSITIQNNQTFYIRATSPPFNTNPNGLTNSASFSVTVGTVQRFFTLTTRAPDVNETFNYSNKSDYVPYPDIDTIPDPDPDIRNQSNPYIQTNTLLVDDVELGNPYGVEIKSDKPDTQVRIRRSGQTSFGTWQDVRSI
jgi:hypothetical protein